MENTTHITLVFEDSKSAEELGNILETESDLSRKISEFCHEKGIDIFPPESLSFDHYERTGSVINATFTSGSTDVTEFISPLSRVTKFMYGELVDDEVYESLRYTFIDGKKSSVNETIYKMLETCESSSLGRAGQYIRSQNRLETDKSYALRHALANKRKASVIQELLEQGADANSRDRGGYSCLYHAVTNKSAAAVDLLIKHGADINSRSCTKGSASTYLYEACRFSAQKIIDILLINGADPNVKDKFFKQLPIEMAIENHLADSVKKLIEHGATTDISLLKLNCRSFHSNHCGKLSKKLEIFKELLKIPLIKDDFLAKKESYLRSLSDSLKKMHPEKRDHDDFQKMLNYLSNFPQ